MMSTAGNSKVQLSAKEQLFYAASAGDSHWLAKVLSLGTDPDSLDESGATPLILSARFSKVGDKPLECARLLLAHGANVNHVASLNRDTALNAAVEAPHLGLVKFLVDAGATVTAQKDAEYCLYNCSDEEIAAFLLEHGANPLARGVVGDNPLQNVRKIALDCERSGELEIARNFRQLEKMYKKYLAAPT